MNLRPSDPLSRRLDLATADAADVHRLLHQQWLVTNGLGDDRWRGDLALPRPADRRAAGALRPRPDVEPPGGSAAAAGRPGGAVRRTGSGAGGGAGDAPLAAGVPARGSPAGLAVRDRGSDDREADPDAEPAEHGACHLPGWTVRAGRPAGWSCVRRCILVRSNRRSRRTSIGPTKSAPAAGGTKSIHARVTRRCGCRYTRPIPRNHPVRWCSGQDSNLHALAGNGS